MAALLALAVVVTACNDDDSGEPGDTGLEESAEQTASGDADPDDGPDDGPGAQDAGDPDEQARDGDTAPASDRVIDTSLTAADGYSDALDVEIPDPETAVLEFAGQRFTFDVRCFGTGEVPDTIMDGNRRLNEFLLFNFAIRGSGQTDDGRNVRIDVTRGIFVDGDRALQIRNMEWGGEGQLDRLVFGGLGQASSLVQSPSSVDPEGDRLPVVRVTPEGVVTAEGEMTREFADDDDAPEGPFTFAGRCQEAWPQDELDAADG